jgi:hypothetical protein
VDGVVARALTLEAAATVAYLPLLNLPEIAAVAGPGVLGSVLLAARDGDLLRCQLLLEHPGAAEVPERLGPPPDPKLEQVTLGHRKAAARGQRSPLLDRIIADPDPRVVHEVLRNPRLREWEVLAIASRRPCPEEVFRLLACSENWVQRPAVRLAMALNPHTPPQLALGLTVLLTGPELDEVRQRTRLHPAVREGAVQILTWRGSPAP